MPRYGFIKRDGFYSLDQADLEQYAPERALFEIDIPDTKLLNTVKRMVRYNNGFKGCLRSNLIYRTHHINPEEVSSTVARDINITLKNKRLLRPLYPYMEFNTCAVLKKIGFHIKYPQLFCVYEALARRKPPNRLPAGKYMFVMYGAGSVFLSLRRQPQNRVLCSAYVTRSGEVTQITEIINANLRNMGFSNLIAQLDFICAYLESHTKAHLFKHLIAMMRDVRAGYMRGEFR